MKRRFLMENSDVVHPGGAVDEQTSPTVTSSPPLPTEEEEVGNKTSSVVTFSPILLNKIILVSNYRFYVIFVIFKIRDLWTTFSMKILPGK